MSGCTADLIAHHGVLEKRGHLLQTSFAVNELSRRIREVLEKKKD